MWRWRVAVTYSQSPIVHNALENHLGSRKVLLTLARATSIRTYNDVRRSVTPPPPPPRFQRRSYNGRGPRRLSRAASRHSNSVGLHHSFTAGTSQTAHVRLLFKQLLTNFVELYFGLRSVRSHTRCDVVVDEQCDTWRETDELQPIVRHPVEIIGDIGAQVRN